MKKILVAPTSFQSRAEMERFLESCEKDFEKGFARTLNELNEHQDTRVITLSGPTCSGKTTAARKIVLELERLGKQVHVISLDDFYYDNTLLRLRSEKKGYAEVDYDSPDTIDLEALEKFEDRLFGDGEAECPIFDFVSGKRVGYKKIPCDESSVFIFEGIQALYPEVTTILAAHEYRSVYISPESAISLGDEIFEPNELRLLRRLVRDSIFRNTPPELTFSLWKGVRKNEDKNILPYAELCEMRIDSSFSYELSVLRPYLFGLLGNIDPESEYKNMANDILRRIEAAPSIPSEYISSDSLYKEFV
ncbi:MAG: hypothetical protein E7641_07135 [Ruminococcaceae bacterium]|nr:hypothetical protein [Oscillospiraceae bacterium]